MEIRTVRKPGDKGTQRLMRQYGDRLVCLRYRYDMAKGKRYKTVELIIAEEDWRPPERHPQETLRDRPPVQRQPMQRLGIRLAYEEADLRQQIKAAGGLWDPNKRVWFVPAATVQELGLTDRVV